jgi:hypothetical protein
MAQKLQEYCEAEKENFDMLAKYIYCVETDLKTKNMFIENINCSEKDPSFKRMNCAFNGYYRLCYKTIIP